MTNSERTNAGERQAQPTRWWRDAVIYQVYVRSFADSDGDGMGDMAGIRSRLPYIRDLGVDAIWFNPFYPSPQRDAGYDVADYCDIDPRFGSLADFDAMLTEAHELGLRVIVDIVPNHTSSEHPWFQAALAAAPGSIERGRYLFRDGHGPAGKATAQQLEERVRRAGLDAGDRARRTAGAVVPPPVRRVAARPRLDEPGGCRRIRVDPALLARPWRRRISHRRGSRSGQGSCHAGFVGEGLAQPRRPRIIRTGTETRSTTCTGRGVSCPTSTTVSECSSPRPGSSTRAACPLRARPTSCTRRSTSTSCWLVGRPTTSARRSTTSITAVTGVGAPPTWVLSNHDVIRHVTRYGGGEKGTRRARAAALLMLALPGSAYVYQGEELGLPEVEDLPDDVRQDPTFARTEGKSKGRDGCRVPIPWSGESPSYGFGPTEQAWLPQPREWAALSVEREAADPDSTLNLYRHALQLRRELAALGDGELEWLESDGDLLAFRREPGFVCVVNVGDADMPEPASLPAGSEVLIASTPLPGDGTIPGSTAVWYRARNE